MTNGCLESNPGPLEKQPVLLTPEHHSNALTVFLGKEQGWPGMKVKLGHEIKRKVLETESHHPRTVPITSKAGVSGSVMLTVD